MYREIQGAPKVSFSENVCSEDDLKSRIFGTFVVKLFASTRIFEHLKNVIIAHFLKDFYTKKVT